MPHECPLCFQPASLLSMSPTRGTVLSFQSTGGSVAIESSEKEQEGIFTHVSSSDGVVNLAKILFHHSIIQIV